jgi:hypothetical protein
VCITETTSSAVAPSYHTITGTAVTDEIFGLHVEEGLKKGLREVFKLFKSSYS